MECRGDKETALRWEELSKHERFGIAVLGCCGTIIKCTPSFAAMLDNDTIGVVDTSIHDHIHASDVPRVMKRLSGIGSGAAAMASLDLMFLQSESGSAPHAVEMIPFGDNTVWLIAFRIDSTNIRELQEKLEQMKDKLVHFAQLSLEKNIEVNINTTNITGDKNQSVQAEEVDNASQDN